MCLVALAIDQSRRFPLVIAANRDEYYNRPASGLAWWLPDTGGPPILAGRDDTAGGTWMGLTAEGRLALVTNVRSRDARPADPAAPSRGRLVSEWLSARDSADRYWMRSALLGYNGFNLVAADFRLGECFWASNRSAGPRRLDRGLYGLSNALLDTPWPKVVALKQRVGDAIACAESVDALIAGLFEALGDRTEAEAGKLPDTGLPPPRERQLSAAFISIPESGYGTRCSTLVITERIHRRRVTHVLERGFSDSGAIAALRRTTLANWPPRFSETLATVAHLPAEIATATAAEEHGPEPDADLPKRTRIHSLLRPYTSRSRRPVQSGG